MLIAAAGLGYGGYAGIQYRHASRLLVSAGQAMEQRDFTSAYALLVDYLNIRPRDARAHLLAARAARRAQFEELFYGPRTELLEQASRHLDDCSRLNGPPDAISLERLLLRLQQGEMSGTEGSLVAYAQTDGPDVPLVLEGLIQGYLRGLRLDRARFYVEELLARQPDNAQALVWRGRIKEQFSQFPSAKEDYEKALRCLPGFDLGHFYLAENLLRANNAQEAACHLESLRERLPNNALVRLGWARCQAALGHVEEARALLDDWLSDTPLTHARRLEALTERAKLALELGQPIQAEDYARQALQVSPLDQYALYSLYRSLTAQGRDEQAKETQAQLDRIKQDLQFVSKGLTKTKQTPDDLDLRQQLGEAYLRLGRAGEALVWFHSVLDRDPSYRPTLVALADYYEQQGNASRAAELHQRLGLTVPAPNR
jgi:tetratricopeptide (TPR) repeat protein